MFDYDRWEPIDEVLRMDGAQLPEEMPVLETHDRSTLDTVLGSARGVRVEGGELRGRLFLAEGTPRAENAWKLVSQGHLRAVSVGYSVAEFVDIAPGQSGIVQGKTYTAGKRTLRITTKWVPREVSLVPIGADPKATLREQNSGRRNVSDATVPGFAGNPTRGFSAMNKALREFLASLGMRADSSDADAWAYFRTLEGEQFAQATQLLERREVPVIPLSPAPAAAAASDPPAPSARADSTPLAAPVAPAVLQTADPVAGERQRVASIMAAAGDDVPGELSRQAIVEGWPLERAQTAFLGAIRQARTVVPAGGPAIHVRGADRDVTRLSLASAMLQRSNVDPVRGFVEVRDGTPVRRRNGAPTADLEQAADRGYDMRSLPLYDIIARACRLDGLNFNPDSRTDLLRAAASSSSVTAIFTTAFAAQLLPAYEEYPDTTRGWTSESDVPNFQSNERASMGKMGDLQRHRRGAEADDMDVSDSKESYKIARFSGKFTIDEMDLIDDRFGALEQLTPQELGNAAAAIRPNLVYYILLANAALDADSTALFDATTHLNYWAHADAAFSAAALQTAIAAMAKQRIRTRPLNIRPRYLLVPQDLRFAAEIALTSAQRMAAANVSGDANPLRGIGIEIVYDDRLGVAGVKDPITGTTQAGTAINWFLAAKPGEGGARTIEVGYLRGQGRAPQIRSYVQDKGRWGIGWDINLDIGGKALDYRGLYMSKGSA